jgi:hypothetical protein
MSRNDAWTDEAQFTRFHEATQELFKQLEKVVDESSFLTYLGLLIEDHDRFREFWTNSTTREYLAGALWWGGGSFKDGDPNEPALRRVATMLTAARFARDQGRD